MVTQSRFYKPGADLGGRGFWGCNPPPPNAHIICNAIVLPGVQMHIIVVYIAMSMVITLISSEQVVKPHSRLTVVKPEVLHLFD